MTNAGISRLALGLVVGALLVGCSAESRRARTLERAGEYFRSGDYEKARIEYQNVLHGDPENVSANEQMAIIWLDRGAPLRALSYLSKVKAISPGNLKLRLKLAELMLAMGHPNDAFKEARMILERSAGVEDALVVLTESVRSPEDFKTAEQIWQKFPDQRTASYQIATANLSVIRGDLPEAKSALQRAVAMDPKSPAARAALGGFLAGQNMIQEALTELKLAAGLSPIRSLIRVKYIDLLTQTGSVEEAENAAVELTRKAADYLPAYRALVRSALVQKKYDEAESRIQEIFKRHQSDYETRLLQARLWLSQGKTKQVIGDLEKFGRDFPGLGLEKQLLAIAYDQAKERDKAVVALQEAVMRNPDNIDAQLHLARLLVQGGDPQPAAASMAQLINNRPSLMPAYSVLIEATRAMDKLDQAAAVIASSIKKLPNNPQLHYMLGVLAVQLQKPAEARLIFERALALKGDYLAISAELVALDLNEGKTDSARGRAKEMIAKTPDSAVPWFLMARTQGATQNWDEAEASILNGLELDSKQAAFYRLLSDSFLGRKDDPNIVAKVDAILAKRPADELAHLAATRFYNQTKNFTKARDVYVKFLESKPEAAVMMNNLAALYDESLGEPALALEWARKARNLQPTVSAFADTLGWILYRQKAYQEALPFLEEAAKAMPNVPEIQYHFGAVQRSLGNKESAIKALKIATESTTEFSGKEDAKRQLAALEQGL